MSQVVIAIDGFSSCGKSTLAKDIAKQLKLIYIDTGAMYRAATLIALRNNYIDGNNVNEPSLLMDLKLTSMLFKIVDGANTLFLNGENVEREIRSIEVSSQVSLISTIPSIRELLVERQREMGANSGVILDGRDIGTTVFPNADVKIFVTAMNDIRAKRRFNEMVASGAKITMEEVAANIKYRDYMDQNRATSPLKKADDAIVLDNSCLSKQEQLQAALDIIKSKRPDIFQNNAKN